MTEAMLALTIRGVVMVLMIAAAMCQLVFGYRAYRAKSELGSEKSTLHLGDLKISSNSVGAFVMASAVAWAIPPMFLAPDYSRTPDSEQVAALPSALNFQTASLKAANPSDSRSTLSNPAELEKLFSAAAGKAQQASFGPVALDGVSASFDLNTVKAVETGPNTYAVESLVSNGSQAAIVTFTATQQDGEVSFTPTQVTGKER
jgi:hypothetical protein